MRRLLVLIGLTSLALTGAPVPIAQAATAVTMDPLGLTRARCQAPGLGGFGFEYISGALANGDYGYVVTAVTAAGEQAPACPPLVVALTGTQNSVYLNWRPVPGATSYVLYRATGTGPLLSVTTLDASSACAQVGSRRCLAFDLGAATTGQSPPAVAAGDRTAGHHVDLAVTQRLDYGGDSETSVKTDVVQLPPGLGINSTATARCARTGAGSLLGDPDLYGSTDPQEDQCAFSKAVGEIDVEASVAWGVETWQGDVFLGAPASGEHARLMVVIRPSCSASYAFAAPGSPTCSDRLGASDREIEKLFLVGVVTNRGGGAFDVTFKDARDGGPIPAGLTVLSPNGQGGFFRAATTSMQIRRLSLRLYGFAQKNTLGTSDDAAFLTLPLACGSKAVTSRLTTWADATVVTATRTFSPTFCAPRVTLDVSKTTSRVSAKGTVKPFTANIAMKVTLYRKRDGSFHAVKTKRPALSDAGSYRTSFDRPKPGTCKITAVYPGDSKYRASSVSQKFQC